MGASWLIFIFLVTVLQNYHWVSDDSLNIPRAFKTFIVFYLIVEFQAQQMVFDLLLYHIPGNACAVS